MTSILLNLLSGFCGLLVNIPGALGSIIFFFFFFGSRD